MSGSTTPVSSAASYSDADVRAQSVWQAEVNKLKVAQLDELLNAKGVKPKGIKAEKAMEVAWRYTKEEIADWRAKQQEVLPPPAHAATSLEDSGGLLPAEVRAAQTVFGTPREKGEKSVAAYTAALE